jgi:hypothetical protein
MWRVNPFPDKDISRLLSRGREENLLVTYEVLVFPSQCKKKGDVVEAR